MLQLLSMLGLDPESLTRLEHTQRPEETSPSPGSSSQLPRQDPRLAPPEGNAPSGLFAGASNCDVRHGTFNDVAGDQFNLKNVNISMQDNDSLLDKLPIVKNAGYQAVNIKPCLMGTREEELRRIEKWEADHTDKRVYWLNGRAGCGKSTIARTFAEHSSVGATFFCSRDFEDRQNICLIFPTLAFNLAHRYKEFKTALIPIIKSDPNIGHTLPAIQFENLLLQPLKSTKLHTTIIIDALDECKEGGSASVILSVLGERIYEIPFVKFFITGRPETPIRSGFRRRLRPHTEVFLLHEVDRASVDQDIGLYVKTSLKEIAERSDFDLTIPWPADEEVVAVVEKSSGLFILSSVIVRYVASEYHEPRERLKKIISKPDSTIYEGMSGIDGMYQQVFVEGFEKVDRDDNDLLERLRLVVGSIVLAFNPLSCTNLALILDMSRTSVLTALRPLHSVLTVPDSDGDPSDLDLLRIYHKSFADFITDTDRCADKRFYIDTSVHHLKLGMMCLKLMNKMLKKNICGLPTYAMNEDIPDLGERRKKYIGGGLEYACQSWAKHLRFVSSHGGHVGDVIKSLECFFKNKLLSWLEVLSIIGDLGSAVHSLRDVRGWLIDVGCSDISLLGLVKDSERFVLRFFDAIEASAPHIYASALLFCPTSCHVRAHYQDQIQRKVKVLSVIDNSWDSCIRSIQIRDALLLTSVAFSHKHDLLAVGECGCVEVFETVTGQRRAIFTFKDFSVVHDASLAFSPDDTSLASGRSDGIIYVWDLQTGGLVCTLKGHRGWVSSVAFSPCGNMIASGSDDHSIRIWSVSTHECLCILEGHSDQVQNVSWLGTGSGIVSFSASGNGTVKVWDISEARCLKTFEFADITTALSDGHFPDSSFFAVGCQDKATGTYKTSNGTIKVVDAHTHDVIKTISTNGRVDSIRFLNQDKVMYTANSTFFIHDLTHNINLLAFKHEGSEYSYRPPAISSDGSCIATGQMGDSFVRVWETGNTSQKQDVARHDGVVKCVVFSGDGQRIASASSDAVKVWEATSGRCLGTVFSHGEGLAAAFVTSLTFSPDSTLLARGGRSGILIWMIEGNTRISTMAVTGDPTSMQFSPDGSQLASFTCRDHGDASVESMHLELWEVATGDCLASIQVNDDFDTVAFGVGGDSVILTSLGTQAQKRWTISPNTRDPSSSNSNHGDHSPLLMSFVPAHDIQQPTSPDVPSYQVYYKSMDQWILDKQERRLCWVMPDLRGNGAICNGKVSIGSTSGTITIVDVSDVH